MSVRSIATSILEEIRRLGWLIGIAVAMIVTLDYLQIFGPLSKWSIVAYVLAKSCIAMIAFHLVRRQVFPYLDLSAHIARGADAIMGASPERATSLAILYGLQAVAVCVLLGLFGLAWILGVLLAV